MIYGVSSHTYRIYQQEITEYDRKRDFWNHRLSKSGTIGSTRWHVLYKSLPTQLIQSAEWVDWVDEDEEDIRLLDIGEGWSQTTASKPCKWESKFIESVHDSTLAPLPPITRGLMRFLPWNRITVDVWGMSTIDIEHGQNVVRWRRKN